jgi:hypothetical protein
MIDYLVCFQTYGADGRSYFDQYESMTRLSLKQYYAEFVWTFDQAKQLIDWYLTENYEKTR